MNVIERSLLFGVPLGLVIVEAIALVSGIGFGPHSFLDVPHSFPFFVAAAIVIAFYALERKEVATLLAVGTAFELARITVVVAAFDWPVTDALLLSGPGYWYASLLLAARNVLRSQGAGRLRALEIAAVRFIFPGSIPLTLFVLQMTNQVLHQTYDYYLFAFDGLLSVAAAETVGRIFSAYRWIDAPFRIVYYSFILMPCLFIVLWGRRSSRLTGWLTSRWIVAGLFGCALYFVMPGIGPQIAFDLVYPGGLPDPTAVPLALYPTSAVAPRNAMPSLHTTWALLIAIGAWRLGPVPRSVAVVNLIGTVVATLGLREHYVVDLVVAIPFTLGVHGFVSLYDDAAGGRDRAAAAAIGGTLLTAAWLLTIRYGAGPLRSTPWVVSVLVLATMIVSGWLFCRLERGAERAAARFSASTSRLSS